jgi:hypothetical protein
MQAYLVRVGVDQAFGAWNAPVDPQTNDFVYVPIPENGLQRPGLTTPYELVRPALARFAATHKKAPPKMVQLPGALAAGSMHLDPDFAHLTYGDNGTRRGKGLASLGRDDLVVFYAGLQPIAAYPHKLLYALVGLYQVAEVVRLNSVDPARWGENAHTRRDQSRGTDVIVRAERGRSGRLDRCVPIGEFRDRAYRVTQDVLGAWGGLSCHDGFIQRSVVPPRFLEPERFLSWFEGLGVALLGSNNP